jgi:hypothetical protein
MVLGSVSMVQRVHVYIIIGRVIGDIWMLESKCKGCRADICIVMILYSGIG